MSETPNNPAEPTENQGGGSSSNVTTQDPVDTPDVAATEPTEDQGGGSD